MMTFGVGEENQPLFLIYALTGTLVMMVILIMLFLAHQRRNRLNWWVQPCFFKQITFRYDQNLLEMSSQTNYKRCKAISRLDTDEDNDFEYQCYPRLVWILVSIVIASSTSKATSTRKQSRISNVRTSVRGLFLFLMS